MVLILFYEIYICFLNMELKYYLEKNFNVYKKKIIV